MPDWKMPIVLSYAHVDFEIDEFFSLFILQSSIASIAYVSCN